MLYIYFFSVYTVHELLKFYREADRVSSEQVDGIIQFIISNQLQSSSIVDPVEDIILRLHDIGSFRFGSFKLSNGMITPIYVDLRLVISHPLLMVGIHSL